MNKAVVLDLDGTLMETIDDIARATNIMLQKFGYRTLDRDGVVKLINYGAKELVKGSLPEEVTEEKLNECYDVYKKTYFDLDCSGTYVYEGMKEFIIACRNAGYKVCVATNKHLSITKRLCQEKLPDFKFDAILGVDEGVIPKPDPTCTLKMLKDLDVDPKNSYFIGDGDTDVLTAINTNTKGIAVLWGYRNKQALEKIGAKVFANTPKDLFDLVEL